MKKILTISIILIFTTFLSSCGESGTPQAVTSNTVPSSYDSKHGVGKFKDILLDEKLNETMAAAGNKSFVAKCAACHKLTEEKLVGPGWKGVTNRQLPSWIMNFITNTDEMINKDPAAQAQLEICLVRMPNQSLLDDEARNLLEFMRQNDGVK
ncbi:MAG: cytochrome c [Bacteroidota bacterium]